MINNAFNNVLFDILAANPIMSKLTKMPPYLYFTLCSYCTVYWGERSDTLLSDGRCNSVCMCVCVYCQCIRAH